MTTTNKDFRIKNGLVVEGTSATINGNSVLTSASSIDALSDVVITTPATNQVLLYNGTSWVNSTETGDVSAVTSGAGIVVTNGTGPIPSIAVDTAVVATTNNTLTMSGKTLTSPVISTIVNTGTLTLPTSTDTIVGRATTDTLSNKSISLGSNTVTGTIDQFNTALTDGDFATLAGTETLTNKKLSDSTTTIVDVTDNTKAIKFDVAGTTGVTGTIATAFTTAKTITLPDTAGTVITTGDTATVTNTMLAGSIANNKLTNSTISGIALGSNLNTLTIGTGLSGTSYNGSSAVTVAIDSTVATLSGTQTLTNKTLTDSTTSFQDEADNTKKMQFQLSGITTATTRTLTVPNVDGTIITTGDTGTVTSTMIADGTIVNSDISASAAIAVSKLASSTISGVTLGNNLNTLTIGTGLSGTSYNGSSAVTVAIDSTVATLSGTQTLTNKTLTDSTTFFQDETDNTKKLQLQLSGITTATTRTLTVPDASGTIALTSNKLSAFAATTSAELAGIISDETGSGSLVFATSPTLVTPNIGVATGTSFNSITALSSTTPSANGVAAVGTSTTVARADHVHPISALTIGTGLSGTSYNGSSAVTIAIDSSVATTSGSQTLTNKTISLGSNTVSGTTAQFNTALTDGDFATLAGTETFTNKTLGSSTALGANLNAATFKITSLGTPTASTDAATKQYVDDLAQGLHVHASCVTATTSNLTATYANGSSGVGATLTNSGTQAALVIDGVTLAVNDRVLVKNQTTQLQNGIYTVTNIGSASTNWVMTRATDMDEAIEVDGGDFIFVTGGTVNDNTGWVQTEVNVVIGTNNIIFTQFSGAGTYLAGNGLTLTSNTFSINTAITADLSTAQTLTNKTISGANNTLSNIGNSSLTNSSITVNGTAISLGGSGTITANNPNALTIGTGLSGTSYNGGSAVTIAIDSTVATLSGTQTFTNKTLTDSTTFLQDETDNTKKLQFQLSGITTATTRTLTVPDASGTIALTSNKLSAFAATTSAELAGVISDETGSGSLVFATSPTLTTPNLGTPTSLTLTNATGLPISGITASTTAALGVGTIELGHATDTTLSRSSAGVLAVEGVVVPTISSTNTLTNKSLSDSTTYIVDVTDATKRLQFDIAGTTNITGTFATAFTTAKTITFPDVTGTVITTGDTATVTNAMLAGSIANNKLANSSVTVNGSAISLGGSATITANTTNALTIGTGLSGTSFNGSGAVTIAIDSTVATTSGTQTLTNKSLSASTTYIIDNTDATKRLNITTSGNTTAITGTLAAAFTTAKTLTLPDATDTLVGKATTDTLTNKTINGANNTLTVRLANDISGFGTGVATALGVSTGTAGSFVVNGGALGTPSSGTLTNATGLPVSSGISGLGTGIATALAVNVGTAGAPVINGGALGTPSSGTLTNATGLPLTSGVTGTLPIGNGGTNITTYTTGDILYASATNTLSKLAAGTNGYVLTMASGVPSWAAASGGGTGADVVMVIMGAY